MFDSLVWEFRPYFQDVLSFTLIALAFIWGGGPERAVAAVWLVVFEGFGRLSDYLWGSERQLEGVDMPIAAEDMIAGILWVAIALYANRNYTLWIAGLQLLAMIAHMARALAETISPIAYVTMVVAPGWMQLFLLAIGLTRHIQRKRKYGPYRDWRITRKAIDLNLPPSNSGPLASFLQSSSVKPRDETS